MKANYIYEKIMTPTNIVLFFLIVTLIKFPINFYIIKTYLLIEILITLNFLFWSWNSTKKNLKHNYFFKHSLLLSILSFLLIIILLSRGNTIDKELYRLLTFPILIFSFSLLEVDYTKILKISYYLCIIAFIYLLLEGLVVNIIFYKMHDFNFFSHPFSYALHQQYGSFKSDYFDQRMDFFIKYWRPQGLFGHPHKSSLVIPLSVLLLTYLKQFSLGQNQKLSISQMILFIAGAFLSGVKTTLYLTIIFIIISTIKGQYRFRLILKIELMILLAALFYIVWFPYIFPSVFDLNRFFMQPIDIILLGAGFTGREAFSKLYGFYNESFLARTLMQIGIVFFILGVTQFLRLISNRYISKIDLLIITLLFFLTFHYFLIGEYFIMIVIALLINYNNKMKSLVIPYETAQSNKVVVK
ncbi:MAG: hypothetical protein FD136_255 [Chitinophagaceae bacterium]|nr:MAG: hypothetical protein FD136_255 [Chitinophagaceae bacterium]